MGYNKRNMEAEIMYKEKISRYIDAHRKEMLEDIGALCRINSVKGSYRIGKPYGEGCSEALRTALHIAECYGFAINNYDNYVGTVDMNDKEAQLDILAHLDVVPAGDGWTVTEPFEPVVKDGKIYGRGTADDKGPAIAALYAMRAVNELGIPMKKNVRLILGTDEECGSSDITHYYSVEKEAPMTFSPDASFPVINIEKGRIGGNFTAEFEPSDRLPKMVSFHSGTKTNVVPGAAEALFEGLDGDETETLAKSMEEELGIRFTVSSEDGCLKIAAAGENGHAMAPWKGKNALTGLLSLIERLPLAECGQVKAVRALNRLMPHGDWYGEALGIKMSDEESGELTLAFSMLDISEKSLEGEFDSRCPICATKENTIDVIRKKMEADGISFNTEEMKPPHHVPADSDFVKTLLSAYEKYSGRKGECIAIGGGTYVHNLKNGVAFGAALPETENHMHGPDEFAVVDELTMSAKIFAQVIVDLCC